MPSSLTGVQTCALDRKSTRLNSSHGSISYAVFCLKISHRATRLRGRVHAIAFICWLCYCLFFFFNDTATTEIYTLSLHDALPISCTSTTAGNGLSPLGRVSTPSRDRKSTRLNSSHGSISYAVFCLKKKKRNTLQQTRYTASVERHNED